MERHIEQFNGLITLARETDIEILIPILKTWIRDRNTGELVVSEVDGVVRDIRQSLLNQNDYKYLVARDVNGTAIGLMGFRPVIGKMTKYVTTKYPVELINAYVSNDERNGKGVGKNLVGALLTLTKSLGYTEVIVNSGPRYKNTAWGFYDKVFGERVGLEANLYGEGGDAPIWRKLL